jgi:hypothetical protein
MLSELDELAMRCREASAWRAKCVGALAELFETVGADTQKWNTDAFFDRLREARKIEEAARVALADAQDALLASAMGFVPLGGWLLFWKARLERE